MMSDEEVKKRTLPRGVYELIYKAVFLARFDFFEA